MESLLGILDIFDRLTDQYGSLEAFVTYDDPLIITKMLGSAGRKFKLKQVGFAVSCINSSRDYCT